MLSSLYPLECSSESEGIVQAGTQLRSALQQDVQAQRVGAQPTKLTRFANFVVEAALREHRTVQGALHRIHAPVVFQLAERAQTQVGSDVAHLNAVVRVKFQL